LHPSYTVQIFLTFDSNQLQEFFEELTNPL